MVVLDATASLTDKRFRMICNPSEMTLSSFSSFRLLARQGSIRASNDRRGPFVWMSIAFYQNSTILIVRASDVPCIPVASVTNLRSLLLLPAHLPFPSIPERHQSAKLEPRSDHLSISTCYKTPKDQRDLQATKATFFPQSPLSVISTKIDINSLINPLRYIHLATVLSSSLSSFLHSFFRSLSTARMESPGR